MCRILIDPGHGGTELGGTYNGILEKDLNLAVAQRLRARLENAGFVVAMTRHQDINVSLEERCEQEHLWKPDIFYSIHHNAGKGKGFEIYHYENSKGGIKLASLLEKEFLTFNNKRYVGDKEMGGSVTEWNYYVLENTLAPAVLTEGCFIDNPEDFKTYNPDVQAEAATKAICSYFGVKLREEAIIPQHWAEAPYKKLVDAGLRLNEKRFDDKATRGEIFALLAQFLER